MQARLRIKNSQEHFPVETGMWCRSRDHFIRVTATQMESLALRISDLEESQSQGKLLFNYTSHVTRAVLSRPLQPKKKCLSWRTSSRRQSLRRSCCCKCDLFKYTASAECDVTCRRKSKWIRLWKNCSSSSRAYRCSSAPGAYPQFILCGTSL